MLKTVFLIGGFVCVSGLTLFQLRFWILGPSIEIGQQVITTTVSWVDITMMVHNTVAVNINGRPVVPAVSGLVKERLYVQREFNAVSIDAYDKYGTHTRKYLYILYPQG